jgi:hypothetical protein
MFVRVFSFREHFTCLCPSSAWGPFLTPPLAPMGMGEHYCLKEWRGAQIISPPGDNFTPGDKVLPWGQSLPPGLILRMGLWFV